jgi:hypothetical protein
MENTFLPPDYKEPAGDYLKLTVGEHNFRILSSAIVGYEYWTSENKPVRSKTPFKACPNIKLDNDGNPTRINFFWAFVIYNWDADAIQIAEVTQKSIQKAIQALIKNKKWGDPKGYDLTITRIGDGFDTEYTVMPNPATVLPQEILDRVLDRKIRLEALYEGGIPFGDKQAQEAK